MWFGPVELNDHALALLADEGNMRDRDDVASMNANEQLGVELGLGLRDRPWAHPFAGTVMDARVMRIRPHTSHIGRIDEMRTVDAFDGKPSCRICATRLAQTAERRSRHLPGRVQDDRAVLRGGYRRNVNVGV